ncbi:cytochrome P450 [Streptomyces smyrnaeus]|uniref:cytochrome P450 family protein n=1 Tax=Streptomyces TaxID=1883 RepID=UPI000C17D27F|nr:cytochrome P450 [Streptomyces sp. RK75]MBQ0863691.1 cytochrome P450 [Streptomyces sp. RK75]
MLDARPVNLLELHPDFATDPYPAYAALRERGPVHRVTTDGEESFWLVVGHEAARVAYTHPRLSRDWRRYGALATGLPTPTTLENPGNAHMLLADPPDHTRLRRLVSREFTPRRVATLAPGIQELTDRLVDAMLEAPERRADLVDAVAFPLRLTVICELLGVPDIGREAFRRWSDEVVAPTSGDSARAAHREAVAHLTGLIAAKRTDPGPDLLSALIHTVDDEGDRLSEDELLSTAFLLLIAGHESTVNFLCNGISALFSHPEQLAALRSGPDTLLEGAIEEMLRYDSPVETSTPRIAVEDADICGSVVPAGGVVLIAAADAGRDPARYDRPESFDIRRGGRGHLSFGHGAHFCLGAPLARLEGRIVLRTLLTRLPGLAPDGPPADRLSSLVSRGIRRLPVRW